VPPIADYTGNLLRAAFMRAAGLAAREFDGGDHPRDAAVLATLQAVGPLSQQHLAKALDVNRTSMVKLIDGLEGRGLVERVRNPDDRRAYLLLPTRAGIETLAELLPRMARAEAELTERLSAAEHARLNELLRALIDTPPPALADRTGFLITRASHRFHARVDAALAPLGIRLFATLARLGEGEMVSQRELADRLRVSTPVVVEIVDELEARGLLERRRAEGDRRLNELHLTPAGHEAVRTGLETLTAAHEDLARPIGEAGDRELRSLLKKLLG
jgi:DNA-binding MarR family transcriptional regulator